MIIKILLAGAASLAVAASVSAQPQPVSDPDGMTSSFITKAAQSDEFERQEGRIAEHHAHSRHVRTFAAEMVKAHTKTTMQLKDAIRKAGMTPPPPPPLTDDQRQMITALQGSHGPEFDRVYVDQQVQAHQETLAVMQGYAQNAQPGPIKDAATGAAPLVQHHLTMAQALKAQTS